MKRRGFLKLLALLPFVPKLAEAAAQAVKPKFIDPLPVAKIITQYEKALTGSDQTSIWFVEWGTNSLPIVEVLNQKNPFLQDMVWQEKNIKLGHNFLKAPITEQYKRKA